MQCSCGGNLTVKAVKKYDVSRMVGLERVFVNWALPVCDKCGQASVPGERLEALMRDIARLLSLGSSVLRPHELRFLRKFLELTQDELGAKLKAHRVTVTKWETDG